tara:strand:- start:62 stop:901 length:840 start_codon:yes stop_codon:yes gene_type:complete
MFIWIASYPKSGNTMIRAMLASYFFTEEGNFNFDLIKNIKQFPETELFKKIGVDIKNEKEVIKSYIKVQESFNIKNSIQFLKTHSYLFNIDNHPFTNLDNSLGVIYVVRDPRTVVVSSSNHNSKTHEDSIEDMIKGRILGDIKKNEVIAYPGTWGGNFNSWKSFKAIDKYLLIKYEDLVGDKEKIFHKILEFIHKLKKVDFILDKKKFQRTIDSTAFEVMQKMESEVGFSESMTDKKTGKKIKFFNLGEKNDWRKSLDINLQKKLQKSFEKEMLELSYL